MRTLLLLIVLVLSPLVAKADQITAGTYRFGFYSSPTMTLTFSGARFSVNAFASTISGVSLPAFYACPCIAGQAINLNSSAFLAWADWSPFSSSVTVNGVSYPAYQGIGFGLLSSMDFLAGSVLLPQTTESSVTISTPFALTWGSISGPGYSVPFTYSGGVAHLTLNRMSYPDQQGRTQYVFSSLVYGFQPMQTPEPMTIALLGSGLVALGLRLRKRK